MLRVSQERKKKKKKRNRSQLYCTIIQKTIKSKPTNPKESKSNAKKVVAFLFKAVLWFLGISIFFVVIFKWIPIPFTTLMIVRSIEQKMDGK